MIITVGEYRELTGDRASADADASAAIVRATRRFEHATERSFELATRTETVFIGRSGFALPSAIPVTAVTTPGATLQLNGLVGGLVPINGTRFATLDYTGGLAPEDIPQEVKDAVAELAARYCLPVQTAGVPAGMTNVSVDSQAYSGSVVGGSASLTPSMKYLVAKWKHPNARPDGALC